eukprot:Transcript_32122.p2 GENE.Transcript_32122~~Transcript_32122.p2  ORF type:complete len:237 (-),score=85.53 Transcript_32122:34-744(-)
MLRAVSALAIFTLAQAKPVITYFGIAGRGEVARLYALVGGLDITYNTLTTGYKHKTPIGYLPALAHPEAGLFPNCSFAFGCLQESLAVERYVRELAPKFSVLTPQEKAVDDMVAMIKEDLIHVEPGATNASLAPSLVTPLYDRYLNVLENDGYVPASGFVNGRAFPSGADLAVLVFLKSGFPFGAALKNAKYDGAARYPKVYALAERTAAYAPIAAYLKTSKTFYSGLDGLTEYGV